MTSSNCIKMKTAVTSVLTSVLLVCVVFDVDVVVGDGEATAVEDTQQVFLREPNDQVC